MFNNLFFILFIKIYLTYSICIEEKNHCSKCNPITKLCIKCDKDIYTPDENGGCQNAYICKLGENQCLECDENEQLCKKCIDGYFPDENGGCSYTENCEISEEGKCLKCKDDYILIGDDNEIKICKSLIYGDLKNCEEINNSTGICEKCKENYYLNKGDRKCSKTENCYKSIFDVCSKCNKYYYLDKRESKCKNQIGIFEFCQESIDSATCDICEENYYFNEEKKCISVNYCLQSKNLYTCEKCSPGYFLSYYGTSCVTTDNCLTGDKDIGICSTCLKNYYLDYKDGKCKSNQEHNDFIYCKYADNDVCIECLEGYELGEDYKCSNSKNCSESINGICVQCIDNNFLGLDNKCTMIEHCIYSDNYICTECEDNYYYNEIDIKCIRAEGNLNNCKSSSSNSYCEICKNDFYLNQTYNICYSNIDEGIFYKCKKTDLNAEKCDQCIEGYYLGSKDYKCSKIEGCLLSENENKCLECDLYYCLDVPTGKCIYNDEVESEEKKFYYYCNRTNEQGTACEICRTGSVLDKNGLCIDLEHCVEKDKDGNCIKCKNDEEGIFCLNKYFGCVEVFYNNNCLVCDDFFDFIYCHKCMDGYNLDSDGNCLYDEEI